MRPLLRRPTLLVAVALVTLPLACAADHGSLGNHVTDTGSGGDEGECAPIQLADVADGNGGFAIDGEAEGGCSGVDTSGAGDVNGDGLADLIVAAIGCQGPRVHRTYVVLGKTSTELVLLADVAQGDGGFVLHGESEEDYPAASVSGAGDVNGDGLADVVVAASHDHGDGETRPRAYVVFGKKDTAAVALVDVADGAGGFILDVEDDFPSSSGATVSTAGDANGDGLADVVVGAGVGGPDLSQSGRTYVVFGKQDADPVALAEVMQGIGGFVLEGEADGDHSGESVTGAGDVNGDGLVDLVVGAFAADPNGAESGRTYVVLGTESTGSFPLADVAQGIGGFVLDGEAKYDTSGFSVSNAGDTNGDGLADVVVGAFGADPNGEESGTSYVVFGKTDTDRVLLAEVAEGVGGFAIDGEAAQDWSGVSVSGAGDLNQDGLADVIVGAPGAGPNGHMSGRAYVVFGRAETGRVSLAGVAQGIGGFSLDGEHGGNEDAAGDTAGQSVSSAGDVNGDGIPDLVIAAPSADPNGLESSGRTYVVFGGDFSCE